MQITPKAELNRREESSCGSESGKNMNTVKIVMHQNLPLSLFLRKYGMVSSSNIDSSAVGIRVFANAT